MKTVIIARDPLDLNSWEKHEGERPGEIIQREIPVWPSNARIYAGHVAESCDVTPRSPEAANAIDDLPEDVLYVVLYHGDPITLITAIVAVASLAAALFLMPSIPQLRNQQSTSPNNSLAERKNAPRPNGRIPDIYGQVRSTPDLIAVPYTVFKDHEEVEVAYMCVGRGRFDIEDVRDDSTLIRDIEGASVEVYGPFSSPNMGTPQLRIGLGINRDVLSAKRITSVNGQTLKPSEWVGPFIVRLRDLDRVSLNIVALQGMFKDDGENQSSTSVSFEIEVTPLDDSGRPSGPAQTTSSTITGSASDQDSKARTTQVNVTSPADQAQVRVRRTTPEDTAFQGTVVDEIKWRDLYAMAPVPNQHFGDVTTVMAQTYATSGALAVKDRKLNMLVTRRLPARQGTYGFTPNLFATKNVADIICAIALDPAIGRLPGGRIVPDGGTGQVDVPQIYDTIEAVVDYFGIEDAGHFGYTFDRDDLSFQETIQIVARAAFCHTYRRGSVLRLKFERPQDDSVLLFNHRNKVPGSEIRTYSFGALEKRDGVQLTYTDPTDDAQVTLYVPQGDDSAINPLEVDGFGIRGFEHAYLHAWRHWNRLQYRYLTEKFTALQEADLLAAQDRFLSADTTRADVMDGEVVEQQGLIIQTSQPVPLDPQRNYTCFLQLSTGVVDAIPVTQGEDEFHLVLETAPSAPLSVADGLAYRTGYVVTEDGSTARPATAMLLVEKEPADGFTVEVQAINYDARYYANDLDFFVTDDGGGVNPGDSDVVDGTPDPNVAPEINPPSVSTTGGAPSSTATFLAQAPGGAEAPTSYFWGVSSGPGYVIDQGSASARLRVYAQNQRATAEFFCDIVVDGVTYRAFCTLSHTYTGSIRYDTPFPSLNEY